VRFVSRRKHHKPELEPGEPVEPNPNPEADEGALWSEAAEAQAAPPDTTVTPVAEAPSPPPAEARVEETVDPLAEIERLRGEAAEYLDGWQRARAEFANFKKRVEREQEEARARVVADVMQDFVAILDDLERALNDRPADGEAGSWASGIDMIYRKLMAVLDAEGVRPVLPGESELFDPNFHEAVSHEESPDHAAGQIIGVIHQGYRIGDRILRPALVRVAK
jgi:molecular chaperone GrpE